MKSILYPKEFDSDDNLYLAVDALRASLGFDYYPGNTSIIADGDISRFPPSGIITLVDQYSSPKERAISFYYGKKTDREFLELELLSDSPDCPKPKKITSITLQVMSDHREMLKNSILAIENFLGTKHEIANEPKSGTIFGRINFLRKVVFGPKAWFEVDKNTGAAPFTTKFVFTGTGNNGPVGEVSYLWKFNGEEMQTQEPFVEKVFLNPGSYTVSLTIKNSYGEDAVTFVDMVKVKGQAPEEAQIKFLPLKTQIHFDDIIPRIRTPINQPIAIEIPQKTENKKTFAGELIDPKTNKKVDAVTSYTWNLSDDLPHSNATKTKALYTVGGLYDLVLRTDTNLGAYRITTYENCIDVVEPINLWVWTLENKQQIRSFEFGLISEVFKKSNNTYSIKVNDDFLEDQRAVHEFWRNNGSAAVHELSSGQGGDRLLYWASGRGQHDSSFTEQINFAQYNGFADIYTSGVSLQRPWNWASLASNKNVYFLFGVPQDEQFPTVSLTNKSKTTYNIAARTSVSESLDYSNFKNGAHDLTKNLGVFDSKFNAVNGHYSAYRTVWKNDVGYILKNSNLGEYFLFKNFYKTEGTLGVPCQNIIKLPDMPGDHNYEGSLVALNKGIYFFNNYGSTYCFNDLTGIWETVNAHNHVAKNELDGLLAASDGESKAYISMENGAFFKFNEIDMSYITFNHHSPNNHWLMAVC
jgi:PKD repeat protein